MYTHVVESLFNNMYTHMMKKMNYVPRHELCGTYPVSSCLPVPGSVAVFVPVSIVCTPVIAVVF